MSITFSEKIVKNAICFFKDQAMAQVTSVALSKKCQGFIFLLFVLVFSNIIHAVITMPLHKIYSM